MVVIIINLNLSVKYFLDRLTTVLINENVRDVTRECFCRIARIFQMENKNMTIGGKNALRKNN